MEELFDKELRDLVRFTDATQKPARPVEAKKIQSEETNEKD